MHAERRLTAALMEALHPKPLAQPLLNLSRQAFWVLPVPWPAQRQQRWSPPSFNAVNSRHVLTFLMLHASLGGAYGVVTNLLPQLTCARRVTWARRVTRALSLHMQGPCILTGHWDSRCLGCCCRCGSLDASVDGHRDCQRVCPCMAAFTLSHRTIMWPSDSATWWKLTPSRCLVRNLGTTQLRGVSEQQRVHAG